MKSTKRTGFGVALLALVAMLFAFAGSAAAKDRNHDRIPDRWEKRHGLSLKVKQTFKDQDRDNLRNRAEFRAGDDPKDEDSDDDGIEDGDESAGTITAWDPDTGALTINVFNDGDVTGTVTDSTEVECDNGDDHGDEDGDGEGGDDDTDSGDDDSVDDRAAREDGEDVDDVEEGDDHSGDCSADDLAVGVIVQEADLSIVSGVGLVFDEIEIDASSVPAA
jgi:hypothetical protein